MNKDTEMFMNKLRENHNNVQILTSGSSIKLCLVAEGTAHIYPRFAPTMEWDTAAGQAIIEGAGGKVLNYKTGEDIQKALGIWNAQFRCQFGIDVIPCRHLSSFRSAKVLSGLSGPLFFTLL